MTFLPEPEPDKTNHMSYFHMHQAIGWLLFESIHGDTYNDQSVTELAENLGNFIYEEMAEQADADFIDGDVIRLLAGGMWEDLTAHFGDDLARETYPVTEAMPYNVRKNIFIAEDEAPQLYDTYDPNAYATDPHAKLGMYFFCLVLKKLRDRELDDSIESAVGRFLHETALDDPKMKIGQQWANHETKKPKPT